MNPENRPVCPECGNPLPTESRQGICPTCLMAQALASQTIPDEAGKSRAVPPPLPDEIAGKFPQFEIMECLGRGGMGVVYKARQKSLNRTVAIKILAPEREHDTRFAERFAREAELLAKLSHPNIVTIHDFGEADGLFYLVMEFVDGVNLRDLLREGKIEPKQALAIVPPICDALQYAHEKGIVHRDIKPENLLLDREGRVKIADFGIAALVGAEGESTGTPQYMAPEQTEASRDVDNRADIYALGVVLYEMLTGERPGKDVIAPSRKVEIDVRLDEIVLRALEKKPELRYQQASVFKTMVETIASTLPGPGVQAAPAPSGKQILFFIGFAVAACINLIAAWVWLYAASAQAWPFILHLLAAVGFGIAAFKCYPWVGGPVDGQGSLGVADFWEAMGTGNYARAWSRAAPHFKRDTREDEWVAQMERDRRPLGKAVSRKTLSLLYLSPGTRFEQRLLTSFDGGQSIVEEVVAAVQPDGEWRVEKYQSRPATPDDVPEADASPAGPSRFSRTARVGLVWGAFVALPLIQILMAKLMSPDEMVASPLWWVTSFLGQRLLSFTAPIGMTVLGWIAVSQIRRSQGRLRGMALAVFDGLLFPLLAVNAAVVVPLIFYGRASLPHGPMPWPAAVPFGLVVIVLVVANVFAVRRVWRAVNADPGTAVARTDRSKIRLVWVAVAAFVLILGAIVAIPAFWWFSKADPDPQELAQSPQALRSLPTDRLIEVAVTSPVTAPWPWTELERRPLTDDDVGRIMTGLTEWLKRDHPEGFSGPLTWLSSFLTWLEQRNMVSDEQAVDFVAALQGSIRGDRKLRLREGDGRLELTEELRNRWTNDVLGLALMNEVKRVTIDGRPVDWANPSGNHWNSDDFRGALDVSGLSPGKHEVTVEVLSALVPGNDVSGLPPSAPASDWPSPEKRWTRTARMELTIYPRDAQIVDETLNPALDPAKANALSVKPISIFSRGDKALAVLEIDINEDLPVPISCDVELRVAGQTFPKGSVVSYRKGDGRLSVGGCEMSFDIPALPPDVTEADVVLIPNPKVVETVGAVDQIWGGKITFSSVPLKRLDRNDAEFVESGVSNFGPVIERTLNDSAERLGNEALCLANGKLLDLPKEFGFWPAQKRLDWMKSQNADFFCSYSVDARGWILNLARVATWTKPIEEVSMEDFVSALEDTDRAVTRDSGIDFYPLQYDSRFPSTLVFETESGIRGALQVVAPTQNPHGAKIRYKLVQRRALSADTGDSAAATNSLPLAVAVNNFNARYASDPVGKTQPPLTEGETVAAIRAAMADRDTLLVSDQTLQRLERVLETRRLPDDFQLEALSSYQPDESTIQTVWSVRLRVPGGPFPDGTTCVSIRETDLGSRTIGKHEREVMERWRTSTFGGTVPREPDAILPQGPYTATSTYEEERRVAIEQDKAEAAASAIAQSPQIIAETWLAEVPADFKPTKENMTREKLSKMTGVDLLTAPTVSTANGREAVIEIMSDESRKHGVRFELLPEWDGARVRFTVKAIMSEAKPDDATFSQSLEFKGSVEPDELAVFSLGPIDGGRQRVGAIRFSLVDALGEPIEDPSQGASQGVDGRENAGKLAEQGWALWRVGRMADARLKFSEAVKLASDNADAWNGLGWACFNSGDVAEAEKAFQKVIALKPDHPAALNGLGQIALSRRDYQQAEGFLLEAAQQNATAAWFGLVRLYLLEGKFDQAEKWAQRLDDSGQGDAIAKKMLEAAKEKRLPEGLKMTIEPPAAPSEDGSGGR